MHFIPVRTHQVDGELGRVGWPSRGGSVESDIVRIMTVAGKVVAPAAAAQRLARGQCSRTSPCALARYMARRLALLALLACAVAVVVHRPHYSSENSDSASFDPFAMWDDYDSYESVRPPRLNKTSAKVILRGKLPKVNVTVKTAKGQNKKNIIKSTTINIQSHANFIMTKKPTVISVSVKNPAIKVQQSSEDEYEWMEESSMVQVSKPSPKRPSTTRRPSTTQRRTTTTRRPTTRRSTTRRTTKPINKTQNKKIACLPKNPGWLSTYFKDNKLKSSSKKPSNSGWFLGRFNCELFIIQKSIERSHFY